MGLLIVFLVSAILCFFFGTFIADVFQEIQAETVKFKKLVPEAVMPEYATNGSAGFDLVVPFAGQVLPGARALVRLGFSVKLPTGMELQVRPRSGLALKKGITVLNSPGTIDSDYTGEVGVILFNSTNDTFHFGPGDRIAQGVLARYETAQFEVVDELPTTERGQGGFGSTDLKKG